MYSSSSEGADGLDEPIWQVLCESVLAAHDGDAKAHASALMRFGEDVPVPSMDIRAGAYLWYLLRYRIGTILGHRPSREELAQLAGEFYPDFSRIVRVDQSRLEDVLLTVSEMASKEREVKGGMAITLQTAALGVMLDDAENQLSVMRPKLASWWRRNSDKFNAMLDIEMRKAK